MKILCVIDDLGSGGAQRQLVELAIGFKEHGHLVSFLVYHDNDFFRETLEYHDIPIYRVHTSNYISRLYKVVRFIKGNDFGCVLSFLEASSFMSEIATIPYRRWRLIVGERSSNPKILRSFKLRFYRWFHLLSDYVVTNSQSNLEIIRKVNPLLSDGKCKVIYNALRFSTDHPSSEYSFRENGVLKILVGASHQYLKNSIALVEAINLLSPENKLKVRVHWYGDRITPPFFDGSYKETMQLVSKYKLNDVISFFPATNRIMSYMDEADVVGLFSFYEGLPNLICEAMSLGKPVMVSNVSDMRKFLDHQPKQIFDPYEISSITRTIEWYLQLNEVEVSLIGRENYSVAKAEFARDKIIGQYLDLMIS